MGVCKICGGETEGDNDYHHESPDACLLNRQAVEMSDMRTENAELRAIDKAQKKAAELLLKVKTRIRRVVRTIYPRP